jgi:hypothetical protein
MIEIKPCVYVVRSLDSKLVKIGFTTNLINRLASLTSSYGEIETILTFMRWDARPVEIYLHSVFSSKQVILDGGLQGHTEWFRLEDAEVLSINSLVDSIPIPKEPERRPTPRVTTTDIPDGCYELEDVVARIISECAEAGSQKAIALRYGVQQSYISDILTGRKLPGRSLLKAMKLKITYLYQPGPDFKPFPWRTSTDE